jgi:hypothetical protein
VSKSLKSYEVEFRPVSDRAKKEHKSALKGLVEFPNGYVVTKDDTENGCIVFQGNPKKENVEVRADGMLLQINQAKFPDFDKADFLVEHIEGKNLFELRIGKKFGVSGDLCVEGLLLGICIDRKE